MKKIVTILLCICMVASLLVGCGKNDTKKTESDNGKTEKTDNTTKKDDDSDKKATEIYFFNFKPEIADKYEAIAKEYKEKTGVTVKVVTAASGEYEKKLLGEMEKEDAPTIFQINGPVGYQNWKDSCADLKDTNLYKWLKDKSLAVKGEDGGIYGVPYAVEGYGIIYNKAIMDKYFALKDKAVTIKSTEEIKNYTTLKQVVEDMTKHKKELGIDGVFASTSMKGGEQWRWQTHLASIPIYYECKDKDKTGNTVATGLGMDSIQFKYAENFKNVFDLYINNSDVEKGLLGGKSVTDSMAEFALGKVAMVQNGNWGWSQVTSVKGYKVKEEDIKMLPIYTGVKGEETQGICVGTENYFCINSEVSEEKQKASIDFLEWLYSSDEGRQHVVKDLGFIAPFTTFGDADKPADPLAKEVIKYQNDKNLVCPQWTFSCFPSEEFKNVFGSALLKYVQGQAKWDEVTKTVIDSWKSERAASN
ncbi:hypothetical protein lbkm_1867 [Lachnospiraceae bacterium KM106-2]|nr:hypothetical protein lbkm_1867 [Lachnospiraceae bacterium KM106-2]